MSEGPERLAVRLDAAARDVDKYLCLSAARELQAEAADTLCALKDEVLAAKREAVAARREDDANALLSLEHVVDAIVGELRMWLAFKSDHPHVAWERLVDAQHAAQCALQAHEVAGRLNLERYALKLDLLERLLFPPQVFTSMEFVAQRATCSICGGEYGECGHILGRPYMGELCGRDIEVAQVTGLSLVDEPANKSCRILEVRGPDGVARDRLTWRAVQTPVPKQASPADSPTRASEDDA